MTGVNDAPVATTAVATTSEDTSTSITLAGSDVEDDALTFSVVTGPANGVLAGAAPSLTYTPDADFDGTDSFTFTVSDGVAASTEATVSIDVSAVNDAPVATSQNVSTDEDMVLAISLAGNDVDNDPLTFALTGAPANGALTGDAPSLTYTPNANYNGPDSFTFTATDGELTSMEATVLIDVAPVNDPPSAADDEVTLMEDAGFTPLAVLTNDTSAPDTGETLRITAVSVPSQGGLSSVAPDGFSIVYRPVRDFNGVEELTYVIDDGVAGSESTATATVTVLPVNDAPSAIPQNWSTDEDTSGSAIFAGVDIDGDPLLFAVVQGPQNGLVTGSPPSIAYTPNLDYVGPDSLTFSVSDGEFTTTADFQITVRGVNDPPSFDPIPQQATSEDAGPQSVPITGVLGGPPTAIDEASQAVFLNVRSTNPTLLADLCHQWGRRQPNVDLYAGSERIRLHHTHGPC